MTERCSRVPDQQSRFGRIDARTPLQVARLTSLGGRAIRYSVARWRSSRIGDAWRAALSDPVIHSSGCASPTS